MDESIPQIKREQLLRLVARGFHRELLKYGVEPPEVMAVATHLLDNLLSNDEPPASRFLGGSFRVSSVRDEWQSARQLQVGGVSLRPLDETDIPVVTAWLGDAEVRNSFVPAYPEGQAALRAYFLDAKRDYLTISYEGRPVGVVGAEQLDASNHKLEMKKLVGENGLRGKGIGKSATFAFLFYAFLIRGVHKVYVYSREANIRNINLNSRFGFELEGVFFEELLEAEQRIDIVRMGLTKPSWLSIFG
ncbi:MAG TPA: GNAT family protein [Polyangiaceae bacterium]|nr:GNAT family protein [Polyangiaceae bacterium]